MTIGANHEVSWQTARRLFVAGAILGVLGLFACLAFLRRAEPQPRWLGNPTAVSLVAEFCHASGERAHTFWMNAEGNCVEIPLHPGPAEAVRSSMSIPSNSLGDGYALLLE